MRFAVSTINSISPNHVGRILLKPADTVDCNFRYHARNARGIGYQLHYRLLVDGVCLTGRYPRQYLPFIEKRLYLSYRKLSII